MPIAIAIGAASVIGAGASIISGNKAANAQKKAADQQIAEQRRQYDQDRADLAPYRGIGTGALGMLGGVYGLKTDGTNTGATGADYSKFIESPDYQFRLGEGKKAIEHSASARGLLGSGAALKAANNYAQNTASSEFGNWWNRLSGLAGTGQAATNTGIQAGQNTTNAISNAYQQAGNARASSYANTGAAISNGVNNLASAYLYGQGGGFGGGMGGYRPSGQLPGYGNVY